LKRKKILAPIAVVNDTASAIEKKKIKLVATPDSDNRGTGNALERHLVRLRRLIKSHDEK